METIKKLYVFKLFNWNSFLNFFKLCVHLLFFFFQQMYIEFGPYYEIVTTLSDRSEGVHSLVGGRWLQGGGKS